MSASVSGNSRARNFFAFTRTQNCAVASVPVRFRAKTSGTVPGSTSQGYANMANRWSAPPPGSGKLRNAYGPTRTPDFVGEPAAVRVTSSIPPWLM